MFFSFNSHLIYQQALNENPLKVLSVLFTTGICRCFSKLKGICKREPHANLVNEQILHRSVWPDGINLNHFDLPKEKNLEILIFQEGESFIQHRWMTGISFVVFFSLPLSCSGGIVSCLTFILPPLSRLMRARACKWARKVHTHVYARACTRTSAKWPLSPRQIAARPHWPHHFCCFFFFTDSVHPSSPPPLVCDGAVVVRRHPQRRDDGILRLCL